MYYPDTTDARNKKSLEGLDAMKQKGIFQFALLSHKRKHQPRT